MPMPTSIEIADALREAILRGDYVADQRLIEIDLRERYNATRFVVRTALQVLSAEGLIEVRHNRGARVRSMSLAQAIEVCEVRRALEGLCAARAAERATPADRAELKSLLQRMRASAKDGDVLRYNDLNAALHGTIRRIAGHGTSNEILENLRRKMAAHQFQLAILHGRPAVALPEHRAIVAAITAGDPAAAEAAMREHITTVIDTLRGLSSEQNGSV
jgi:DNA-binding GntR family transcriptional regulator